MEFYNWFCCQYKNDSLVKGGYFVPWHLNSTWKLIQGAILHTTHLESESRKNRQGPRLTFQKQVGWGTWLRKSGRGEKCRRKMSSWEATWCNFTNLATLREVARICLPIFPHKSDELSANDDYSQLMITHIKYQKALVWYRIFRFKWCFLKYVCQWISVFDFSVWQTVAYNSTPPSIAVTRSL